MVAQSKRLFPRHGCRLPIHYRTTEIDGYSDAVLYNCSRTGMYFEPRAIVLPEEGVHILMSTYAPTSDGPDRYCYYLARAVWCRSIPDDKDPRYGCGARLLKCSCRPDGMDAEFICHTCDMCAEAIPCQNLQKTEDFLYLCPSCERHLEAIPEGHLKRSIKRFLLGNVL